MFGILDKDEIKKKNENAKFGMLTGVFLMAESEEQSKEKKRFREDS